MARPAFGIRHQLWALFGLFLLTGASVLAIDELAQQRSRVSLEQMKDQSLQRMRLLNEVSEGYSTGVIDTTFKARNALITWHEGVARVDAARHAVESSWKRLDAARTRFTRGAGHAQGLAGIASAPGRGRDDGAQRSRAPSCMNDVVGQCPAKASTSGRRLSQANRVVAGQTGKGKAVVRRAPAIIADLERV